MIDSDTILQVEDDSNDVFFLQRAFKQAQIPNPVRVARTAAEAIDYLTLSCKMERPEYPIPQLILLDLKLQHTSGFEVLQWVRAHPSLAVIPVIILSSSSQPEDIYQAYAKGANSFLAKPSGTSELTDLARLIRAYWLHANHPPSVRQRQG